MTHDSIVPGSQSDVPSQDGPEHPSAPNAPNGGEAIGGPARRRVLVIDDSPAICRLVEARLKPLALQVPHALDGAAGLIAAREMRPDLILLDVSMPGMDGFEVCRRLKADPITAEMPVIFITGSDDPAAKIRGFELGAVDYIIKPFDVAELRLRVSSVLRTQVLLEQLDQQVKTDALTGLANRRYLGERLNRCIHKARAQPGYGFVLLYLDLDRFKVINDSLGHAIGDQLLMAITRRLTECVRSTQREGRPGEDVVARMGGDEFTILLDSLESMEVAVGIAKRLQDSISRPCVLDGHEVFTTVSIGIRAGGCEGDDAAVVVRDADTAMYQAKLNGKACHVVFNEHMHLEARQRHEMEIDLRRAVERDELRLQYQPVIELESGELVGFEALVRWHHPTLGIVSPARFIPLAEETGVIVPIGQWVLEQACARLREWQIKFGDGLRMNINLSRKQLMDPALVGLVDRTIKANSLRPACVSLEITESTIMERADTTLAVLRQIKGLGVQLHMDDFGTGYSSLSCLHHFPLDGLKIDRAFVANLSAGRMAYAAVVHAIVTLAHNLDMKVVAEGIETADQCVQLQALECDHAQGYFFAKPLDAADAERFIRDRAARHIAA